MSEFRTYRDSAEEDIKSAHRNLSIALSKDIDEWNVVHIEDMHTALSKLNEIKNLFK